MKIKFKLLFITIMLMLSSLGLAVTSIGNVISMQGRAKAINKANQKRALQRRSDIYLQDKIVTQADSKVQLRLNDDSIIIVQSNSEFYISEFSFNNNFPRNNKYVGNLVKGALINISGQGDPKNYKIDSPLSTIAFRGTGLATKLVSRRNKLVNQEIYVFRGYVNVINRCTTIGCQSQSVDIGAGQKANSAMVGMSGAIRAYKSGGFVVDAGCGDIVNKGTSQKESGAISIKCKGKR